MLPSAPNCPPRAIPDERRPGRSPSRRGSAVAFGPDVTRKLLDDNVLEMLVRSHEVKQEGYLVEHNGLWFLKLHGEPQHRLGTWAPSVLLLVRRGVLSGERTMPRPLAMA